MLCPIEMCVLHIKTERKRERNAVRAYAMIVSETWNRMQLLLEIQCYSVRISWIGWNVKFCSGLHSHIVCVCIAKIVSPSCLLRANFLCTHKIDENQCIWFTLGIAFNEFINKNKTKIDLNRWLDKKRDKRQIVNWLWLNKQYSMLILLLCYNVMCNCYQRWAFYIRLGVDRYTQ